MCIWKRDTHYIEQNCTLLTVEPLKIQAPNQNSGVRYAVALAGIAIGIINHTRLRSYSSMGRCDACCTSTHVAVSDYVLCSIPSTARHAYSLRSCCSFSEGKTCVHIASAERYIVMRLVWDRTQFRTKPSDLTAIRAHGYRRSPHRGQARSKA